MRGSRTTTDHSPEATVYDVHGNPVGTVEEIFFDDTIVPAVATAQTRRANAT